MEKLKEKPKQEEPASSEQLLWKWFFGISLFCGIFLMILQIEIYRKTLIDVRIPLSVIALFTVLSYPLLQAPYKKCYKLSGVVFPFLQALLSFGFIACYIFMALNYYGASAESSSYSFPVKEVSSMPGSKGKRFERTPLLRFDFFGLEKELIFHFRDTEKVRNASQVTLFVKNGAFGFHVLEKYEVR